MKKPFLVAFVVSLAMLTSSCVPTAVGGATFGLALDGLLSKVGDLINSAQNAGNILEVGAGGQIAQSIDLAKSTYEHELDVTLDRLTVQQKKLLDDLTTQTSYLENHAVDQLKAIVENGALAANTIPFSKTLPQVSRYKPYYLVPSLGNETLLSIDGNFFDTARDGYAPTLTVDGKTVLSAAIATTLNLSFRISNSLLPTSGSGVSYVPVRLDVPYQASCFLVFSCKNQTAFQFLLVVLPPTAGQLTFITTESVTKVESKNASSQEIVQESNQDDFNDTQHCWPADTGWRVVPSSVSHQITWSDGDQGPDWRWNNNTSTLLNACWNLTTIHHLFGTSGKVHFVLNFREERDTLVPQSTTAPVADLKWGSTKLYSIPNSATWRAVYKQFDGRSIDINSTAFDNPYLRVKTSGNTINFETIP